MSKDDKIRMPSGQGGITRYFEESASKVQLSPAAVLVVAITIIILVVALNYFGLGFFS
ncbi:hypothetical protein COV20_04540 [Candidatus Woesearchaeota archaeon CG10_big_fil_rev_8_21_14_0_10_45_16]|nr:MAG: hypothetical protein COV20_04540 [Candidatus Woesearchaeota archaeon CG10_big_fil_rev_8_21_14_0_10_45_16]